MQHFKPHAKALSYLFIALNPLALIEVSITQPSLSFPGQQNLLSQDAATCRHKSPPNPQTAEEFNQLAYVERVCYRNWDAALKAYTQAIQLDPKSDRTYQNRGRLYYYLKNYRAAIADYTKLLQSGDKTGLIYARRGLARGAMGDFKGAIADYTQALQPRRMTWHGEVYFRRAKARLALADRQGAIEDYRKAKPLIEQQIQLMRERPSLSVEDQDPLVVDKDAGFNAVENEEMHQEMLRQIEEVL